jgi:hypothetical protein
MRKAMLIGLLMMVCSLAAFGQSQPQWVVVYSAVLFGQTEAIPQTTAFTPTETNGVYRLSACLSNPDDAHNTPIFILTWGKISPNTPSATLDGGQQITVVFTPKAGVPLSYSVKGSRQGATGDYDLAFTIEQLQSSN